MRSDMNVYLERTVSQVPSGSPDKHLVPPLPRRLLFAAEAHWALLVFLLELRVPNFFPK